MADSQYRFMEMQISSLSSSVWDGDLPFPFLLKKKSFYSEESKVRWLVSLDLQINTGKFL